MREALLNDREQELLLLQEKLASKESVSLLLVLILSTTHYLIVEPFSLFLRVVVVGEKGEDLSAI